MKYSVAILINAARDEVVEKFDNPDNLKHWMAGLQVFEHIEGEPGQTGAKSKVVFQTGKRRIEMIETIEENALPDLLSASYETNGVYNLVVNRFEVVDTSTTRVINDQEFQLQSLGMRFFAFLMPGMFKKQSMSYLKAFKAFVEDGTSVAS